MYDCTVCSLLHASIYALLELLALQPRTQSYLQLPLHSFSSAQCLLPCLLCELDQRICLTRLRCSPDSSDTQLAAGPAEAELLVHKLDQRLLR